MTVLGGIPRLRFWVALAQGVCWLFLSLLRSEGYFLLLWERWVYFFLFNRELGRGQLFLNGDGSMRERVIFPFNRELARRQLFCLDRNGFLRRRGLHSL